MENLVFSPDVSNALKNGHPVVALESTIITHGMPYPDNLETAIQVEDAVRQTGAVPATIAVMNGRLLIGLRTDEIEELAQTPAASKLSRADLAICLATGGTGSTTVAATMIAAAKAGIAVFATGGIGGVHRGAEDNLDISADLQELAQTHVTVVCAGAKAILDLPKTLEVLETLGVPVIAFGQDSLAAFWSASSNLSAPIRMDHVAQIAAAHKMRASLGIPGGQLVANPIPEEDEIPAHILEPLIEQAIKESLVEAAGRREARAESRGAASTECGWRSLRANKALIVNNARLPGQIALEIANT